MISIRALLLAALAIPAQAAVVTEIDYVTQYAYENYEVIVDPQGNPITTSIEIVSTGPAAAAPSTQLSVSTEPTEPTETTPAAAAAPAAPAATHSHSSPENYQYISVSTSSSASNPPPAPPTTTSSSATPPAPAPQPPTTTSTSSTPAPAPTTSSSSEPAPQPSTTSPSGGGQFSGDATFYDVGLGACGVSNSDSDFIAALNWQQWNGFGSQSNGNPVCGKKATVNYQGKSVTVTIEDKCPGCKHGDLDLSPAAFKQLADEGAGRIQVTWSFD